MAWRNPNGVKGKVVRRFLKVDWIESSELVDGDVIVWTC